MKKAILISIKPEWVEKILNGVKTIEIRKSMPKCDLPIDVYIYCSKGTHRGKLNIWFDYCGYKPSPNEEGYICNGKVVAKFTLNKVEDFIVTEYGIRTDNVNSLCFIDLPKKTQLNLEELHNYINVGGNGYAWHIENLEIFDTPMELNQFEKYYNDPTDKKPCCCGKSCKYETYDWCEHQSCCSIDYDGKNCPFLKVSRPPQSWQYVYVED